MSDNRFDAGSFAFFGNADESLLGGLEDGLGGLEDDGLGGSLAADAPVEEVDLNDLIDDADALEIKSQDSLDDNVFDTAGRDVEVGTLSCSLMSTCS